MVPYLNSRSMVHALQFHMFCRLELFNNQIDSLQIKLIFQRPQAVSSSSSKSKIPSEERNSSSSSSKNHHGHHKKDKKEKHKESEKKEKQRDKSDKSSSHHKHHKSHKSSSSSKDKQAAEVSSNGSSHSASNNGNNIEIPTDINPNYKPPKVRQRYSDQQQTTVCFQSGEIQCKVFATLDIIFHVYLMRGL